MGTACQRVEVMQSRDNNGLKRKNSIEDCGEIAGRMQNAKHVHARTGTGVEDEIALKSGDRHHAHYNVPRKLDRS